MEPLFAVSSLSTKHNYIVRESPGGHYFFDVYTQYDKMVTYRIMPTLDSAIDFALWIIG